MKRDIFVIGASSGGAGALRTLIGGIPRDWPATAFVVLHTGETMPSLLSEILAQQSSIPVENASDGADFRTGRAYIAPPGRHLLLKDSRTILSAGPKENHTRPAIDPLFRSAAVYHGPRVVGVILTGLLDDGSAGLRAVLRCGGEAIVQNPEDAEYGDMPRNALLHIGGDHMLPLKEIPGMMARMALESAGALVRPPDELLLEVRMAEEWQKNRAALVNKWGEPAPVVCPDCGGSLWTRTDAGLRQYRCHVGHAFTAETLKSQHRDSLETALWAALRSLQERVKITQQMALDLRASGKSAEADQEEQSVAETNRDIDRLREILSQPLPEG